MFSNPGLLKGVVTGNIASSEIYSRPINNVPYLTFEAWNAFFEKTQDLEKAIALQDSFEIGSTNIGGKITNVLLITPLSIEIAKGFDKSKLIARKVDVTRNGKTYQVTKYFKSSQDEAENKSFHEEHDDEDALKHKAESVRSILEGSGNKSDKAKKLVELGVGKKTISNLLDMNPSHVYSIHSSHITKLADQRTPVTTMPTDEGSSTTVEGEPTDDVTVEDKWDGYEVFANMVIKGRRKSLVAYGTGGVGKVLEDNELIFTKNGFKTHGTIEKGDVILTPSGRESKVLNIFPHKNHPFYRVTLSDGTSVLAGPEHLWKVWNKTSHWDKQLKKRVRSGRYEILTTQQIIDKGLRLREKKINTTGSERPAEWRFAIPFLPTPVLFSEQKLIIDPYVLGCLIGDGSLSQNNLAISIGSEDQEECLSYLNESLTPMGVKIKQRNKYDFSLIEGSEFRSELKELKLKGTVSHTKFIPEKYLFNSVENRLALLQGLMDTDGSCESFNGKCVYYTASEQLAKDVQQLVLSFGQKASLTQVERKFTGLAKEYRKISGGNIDGICKMFQVYFTMPKEYCPFKLKRKADKWQKTKQVRRNFYSKSIMSIEFEKYADGHCIMIDDPEHLYITSNFITTHNTFTVSQLLKKADMRSYDDAAPEEDELDEDEEKVVNANDYDYVKMTGKVTPTQLYKTLYEHNGKLIMFDDCDSVLDDGDSVNVLKGALDSSGDGTIVWASGKPIKDDDGSPLPNRFKFKGRVIFISNKSTDDFNSKDLQPIKSRSMVVDLSMSKKQTIDRVKQIAERGWKITDVDGNPIPGLTRKEQDQAISFMEDHMNDIDISNFNARTLGNIASAIAEAKEMGKPEIWPKLAAMQVGIRRVKSNIEKSLPNKKEFADQIAENAKKNGLKVSKFANGKILIDPVEKSLEDFFEKVDYIEKSL